MKKLCNVFLGLCLFAGLASVASAQNMSDSSTHGPQILHITREFLKPYRDGSAHEKTEGMYAQAMAAAKWPAHYFGVDSVSGKSRSLFFSLYPSFDAWEKDQLAQQKNATLCWRLLLLWQP